MRAQPIGNAHTSIARGSPDPEDAEGWSGRRAQSAQRGTRSRSRPRTCSGLSAMWMLAGKTATSSASSHQRARRRVPAREDGGAAGDLGDAADDHRLAVERERGRHHRFVAARDHEVHRPREGEEARQRCERVDARLSRGQSLSIGRAPQPRSLWSSRARFQAQPRLHADRRPAEGDRRAGRGPRARASASRPCSARPAPARRSRWRRRSRRCSARRW